MMRRLFVLWFLFHQGLAKIKFNGEGYENLLIGISPELLHQDSNEITKLIENIEDMITEGSNALYKATGGLAYINSVTFLIPYDWDFETDFGTSEVYEDSDIKVVSSDCLMSSTPHTFRLGLCGEMGDPLRGEHISLPYDFVSQKNEDYGPPGKTFLNLWAQYRYGVYEEHGYPNDERYPLVYYEKENVTTALPNACSNVPLQGEYRNWENNQPCANNESNGLFEDNCMFFANKSQPDVTSSIMSLAYINSNEFFCNDTTHNIAAPNRQNDYCNRRSVWSVISDSIDFKHIKPKQRDTTTAPNTTFKVLKQSYQQFILLMDVSGSMGGDKIENMKSETKFWIDDDYQLMDGSYLGILSFSSGFTLEHPLTQIKNKDSRDDQKTAINGLTAGGGTEIGNALIFSAQLLSARRKGGIILLITDGEESGGYSMTDPHVLNTLKTQEIRVFAMALGSSASDKLELLAMETGGTVFFIATDGNGFTDAFGETTTMQPGSTLGRATILQEHDKSTSMIALPHVKEFHVDKTIGRNLRLEIKIPWQDRTIHGRDFIKGQLASSDGQNISIYQNIVWANARIGHISVPTVPENLTWTWTIDRKKPPSDFGSDVVTVGFFTVTSERTNNDTVPLKIECFLETHEDKGDGVLKALAKVTQGSEPVLYAHVQARLETPQADDPKFPPCNIPLLDDNILSDTVSSINDGTYANFFNIKDFCHWTISENTRFNLICEVVGDEDSYMCNQVHARNRLMPSSSETPYCCGSTIPEPKEKSMTGPFERRDSGGSIKLSPPSNPTPKPKPPAPITDLILHVEITQEKHYLIHMKFTAPGNNFLTGKAREFLVKYSTSMIKNDADFDAAATLTSLDIVMGSLEAPLPMTQVTLIAAPQNVETYQTLYFAIKTINNEDLFSPISNLPFIFLPSGQPVPVPPPVTTSFFRFGLILSTNEQDLAECECPPDCDAAQIMNCPEQSDLTCSNSCYCSCQSEKKFGPPFTLSDSNQFSMLTMERTWESDKSSHPPCPTCPCEYDLQKTVDNGNSSVQSCTCFCDRKSIEDEVDADVYHSNADDTSLDPAAFFEDGAIPGSIFVELYEYEDIEDNVPQPSCPSGGYSFVYKGCMSGFCMALNTCIVNTFFYGDSNVHFSMKSNIYIIYVNITDTFDDVMCPEQFCEGDLAEYCNDDHTKCTFQSVCVCIY